MGSNRSNNKMKETGLLGVLGKFKLSGKKLTYKFKKPSKRVQKQFNTNLEKSRKGMKKYSNKTNLGRAFKNALNKKTKKNNKMKRTKKKSNIYKKKPSKPKPNNTYENYSNYNSINLTSTSSNA